MAQPEAKGPLDPLEFLATVGGPSKAQIDAWKQSTCNGRVRLFVPDPSGQRVFILRGLSVRELEQVQESVPANTAENRMMRELQSAAIIKATLWTNVTKTNKLDIDTLRASGAGLTESLYALVEDLSDFLNPQMLDKLSADL